MTLPNLRLTCFAAAWLLLACFSATCICGQQPGSATIDVSGQVASLVEQDWLAEDAAFSAKPRSARRETKIAAEHVTTAQDAAGGCDGIKNGRFGFHTASNERDPWWQVDLGSEVTLDRVVIYNRTDGNTAPRTKRVGICVATDARQSEFVEVYRHSGETFYGATDGKPLIVDLRDRRIRARVVRLDVLGRCSFALDEVEVYAIDNPNENLALGRPADQKSVGPYSVAGTKRCAVVASKGTQAVASPFQLAHTREVIRRGYQLAERLQRASDCGQLERQVAELDRLNARVENLAVGKAATEEVRREVYLQARRLVRMIAFCNPLLGFDKILFVKRHDPGGLYHMVHQYYGFCAKPGGGLFVLNDPFSERPTVTNLLAESRVTHGRLAGRRLEPGTFVSPDLSFDGQSILFAYTEGRAEGIEWSPRASYHLFKVNADGSELVQLTDGRWNEFDPCFLPNGRIVFVSERRGGYLRCGGSAPPYDSPTYTLHSMDADGGDITCLSFHETQEWQPSVDNNGMLVYTRWDYVDRDTNTAHHIWSCFADGRDPRSYHGNYPTVRQSRPWMEMSIRAVPDSNRYVATAAAHHGLAFGSLVLIDYRPVDDNAMSQVERITPDVPFPESEGGKSSIREQMAYGTAWPLSEDDYLCVYDRQAKNRGIYWIDRFGNRELLYRDPAISCLSPIPLRARRQPPRLPQRTARISAAQNAPALDEPATVAVMNVYDGDFAWPADTRITALRVIQVLPKTTPPADQPRIGVATETNARAVLGTVSVEADGSAYFRAPAGKLVYFQALDERGMAVQSMRSATYLHPGEFLGCQGCHEAKHRPPHLNTAIPLALRREPSTIEPDVDGSNPFSYARLVQPVLDRHCVQCHRDEGALDLSGEIAGEYGWSRSYDNLASGHGFYFHVSNGSINSGVHGGSRTIAGQFGARASSLLQYLDQRHHGVRLPREDWHRLTLWLDCNSEFYGAYHEIGAQARGERVVPRLD
jgi:hypothetical protein